LHSCLLLVWVVRLLLVDYFRMLLGGGSFELDVRV
jgi:hypothetical protein